MLGGPFAERSVMNARPLLVAVLAVTAGCGEDAKPPAPHLDDPQGYYGLQVCTCYLYGTDGTDDTMGIGIERKQPRAGHDLLELRFRSGSGALFRTEFVEPTDPDLDIWGVTLQGQDARSWTLTAPLPLVSWPIEKRADAPVIASAPLEYRGSADQTTPTRTTLQQRADYLAPADVTFRRGDMPETAKGVRISYLLSTPDAMVHGWPIGPRTFVPKVGFAKLEELDTGTGARTWNLVSVKPIEGCPFAGEPPASALCGVRL
jgi:hypothetical protein